MHFFKGSLPRCSIGLVQSQLRSVSTRNGDAKAACVQPNGTYEQHFRLAMDSPEDFWAQQAAHITWHKPWSKVLDDSNSPFTKWFVGGELNACYNCLDRHVEAGIGQQTVLVHDSPVTKSVKHITYEQMQKEVTSLAAGFHDMGLRKGDRVLIYMPMIPEAVVAMLATARLGAIHSLVFGGFAAKELSKRIAHAQPKIIVTANLGVEPTRQIQYPPLLRQALNLCGNPDVQCVVFQRPGFEPASLVPGGQEHDWRDVSSRGQQQDCVPVDANDPLYILYTSGTTGDPKGVQRPLGGHLVSLRYSIGAAYGIGPGDTWWAASDLGWVVGHSFICYAPMLAQATSILYEGKPVGTPDASQYFRVISEHGVKALFVAPTAVRAIKREDENAMLGRKYKMAELKHVFVAGEHCDQDTMQWTRKAFQVPALDNWWQTETGHPITAVAVGLGEAPEAPALSSGKPFPGFQVLVLKEDGKEASPGEMGSIVSRCPLPPGFMSTLYRAPQRFRDVYFSTFPGYYDSMDAGRMDENGFVYVTARKDDVINVAGHRLSTSAIEEVLMEHPDVVDCAVFAAPDKSKGHVPVALYVLRSGCSRPESDVTKEVVFRVRDGVGPIAAFRLAAAVPGLPRTRSGKTPRKSLSDMVSGLQFQIPSTIEDASVYPHIRTALQRLGFQPSIPEN